MTGPFVILFSAFLLLVLVFTAYVLVSKNKSGVRFLIWGIFILCDPLIGAFACIITYYFGKKELKTL